MKKNILITGGAGYIGSHTVKLLGENTDNNLFVLDDLSTGHKSSVLYGKFIEGDIADTKLVSQILKDNKIDSVIHFAGSIAVGESVTVPEKYYINNVAKSTLFIGECLKNNVSKFIFSSTASLYGNIQAEKLSEDLPIEILNPYAHTKFMFEEIIKGIAKAHPNFKYVILRYFNVAGASMDNKIGLISDNATHLIKVACELIVGKRNKMYIYGTDYETRDGTCIRDYIHVDDLAQAHISALNYLNNGISDTFNVGYGEGTTVKEVLSVAEKLTNRKLNIIEAERRAGDPKQLVANNSKILSKTDWKPKYNNISTIIKSAIDWEEKIK